MEELKEVISNIVEALGKLYGILCALYEEMRLFSLPCIWDQFSFDLPVVVCSVYLRVLTIPIGKWFDLTLRIPHNVGLNVCPKTGVFVACSGFCRFSSHMPVGIWNWPRQ